MCSGWRRRPSVQFRIARRRADSLPQQPQARRRREMDLGRAITRFVVGPLFVGHGTQKLFGWFEGHGIEGTAGFFESLGLRPGKRHAAAAGFSETAGGVLLTLGALTPL